MSKPRKISVQRAVFILAPLAMATALAMDVYIPAVPHMTNIFHVNARMMQVTLNVFTFVAGLIQLITGPIADQYGRKPVAYVSIMIFAVGCMLCAIARTVDQLIIFRMIQAMGACGMMVVAYAMVRDLFHGRESGKAYSYLGGVIAFSPLFAPFIGSYLDIHFGWQATFLFLLIIALLAILLVGFGMPESLPRGKRIPVTLNVFNEYRIIFTNKIFFYYTLATATGLSYLYIFCSISPYIIIRMLHIPEAFYGYYFAFMGVSLLAGSFIAGFLITRIGLYRTLLIGFVLSLAGGVTMLVWYLMTGLSIDNFVWPMLLIGIGATFILGAGTSCAMEPFADAAGAASALGGSFRFLFSGIAGSIFISKHITSTLPLALPAIIFSVVGLMVFLTNQSLKNIKSIKSSEFSK